jgi:hypothetical protein
MSLSRLLSMGVPGFIPAFFATSPANSQQDPFGYMRNNMHSKNFSIVSQNGLNGNRGGGESMAIQKKTSGSRILYIHPRLWREELV